MHRRAFLTRCSVALAFGAGSGILWARSPTVLRMEVWKDPQCGCCNDWIVYLERNGFAVQAFDTGNVAARQRLGMPERLGSCHTARIGGYVIEGHVPSADILRLLRERPTALGLSVPGMPIGSPGMDGPLYRGRRDAFDVLLVAHDGSTRVWASYPARAPLPAAPAQPAR